MDPTHLTKKCRHLAASPGINPLLNADAVRTVIQYARTTQRREGTPMTRRQHQELMPRHGWPYHLINVAGQARDQHLWRA